MESGCESMEKFDKNPRELQGNSEIILSESNILIQKFYFDSFAQ